MTPLITAERYHDFSCGHRVYQHESKCAHLHGHNYRVYFTVEAPSLDSIGRVMDFSVIKDKLCMFPEREWDHKFLIWQEDPWAALLHHIDPTVVILPFNPTAENMAQALLEVYGPRLLEGTGVTLVKVAVEETRKCSASAILRPSPPVTMRFASPTASTGRVVDSNGDTRSVEFNGLMCYLCGKPQFKSPSGDTCENGHGGAEGVPPQRKA